jgi:putative chitinase
MADFASALSRLWPNGDQKIPGLRAGIIASAPAVFAKYGIKDSLVLAHIMAQISHECGAGHDVVENLNYTAERMTQVWPSRFRTVAEALPYAGNPKALANKVYNGRMGNRLGSDDGWVFRGRGGSQTTGREGYERVAKQTGLDCVNHPEILIDPKYFLECAVSDFINCGCMPFAQADDILNVTKKLNGGYIGLGERQAWLAKWKAQAVPVPVAPIVILPPGKTPPDVPKVDPKPAPAPSFWGAFISAILSIFIKRK